MSGDDSFDPLSWSGKTPGKTALPDAWASVTASGAPATPAPAPPPPLTPQAVTARGGIAKAAPLLVSAAVLALTAGTAWLTRAPPPAAVAQDAGEFSVAEAGETQSARSIVLAAPGDLRGALIAAGVGSAAADQAAAAALQALAGGTGEVRAQLMLRTRAGVTDLVRLEAAFADGSGGIVTRGADGSYAGTRVEAELSTQIRIVRGEVDTDTFYSSAVAAGVIDTLVPEFINAFSFDFDLQREVNPGDTFEVAYAQTVNAAGEALGTPELLFASLTTPAKRRALYRFAPPGGEVGWYDGNGASSVRSLMRTPVDGARISSKFGYRIHPIYGYSKLHGGTDFAAPQGTPVYASGDAVAEFVGPKGCNGNFVRLAHDNGWYTHYLHLVRFAPGMAPGVRVKQGQVIGEVGTTGCSTGPHLHYEIVIDGQKVDPLSIRTEAGRKALEGATLAAFIKQRDRVDVARSQQGE